MRWLVEEEDLDQERLRVDAWLADRLEEVSRSKIAKALKAGDIRVNGEAVKPRTEVAPGDVIEFEDALFELAPLLPENLPLDVLYEDDCLAVINKPCGLIVHPTASVRSGTLVNRLLARFDRLSSVNGPDRPGIVHRLDADTTGVILIAKTDEAHRSLAEQFRVHSIEKYYLAICEGPVTGEPVTIDLPIGRHPTQREKMAIRPDGKRAVSIVRPLAAVEKASLVEVRILTGRTHQIRVHLESIGHPVVGDLRYGRKKPLFKPAHQLLHAAKIRFDHPASGERIEVTGKPDPVFYDFARSLGLADALDSYQ